MVALKVQRSAGTTAERKVVVMVVTMVVLTAVRMVVMTVATMVALKAD